MEQDLKLYYSIKEVSEKFNIPFSSLRFYEKQFPQLKPKRNSKGIRQYSKKDLAIISEIIGLVKKEGHTLNGAKAKLKQNTNLPTDNNVIDRLSAIKTSLEQILSRLI
jgi:DNA-binding transcriptional MerR regulator